MSRKEALANVLTESVVGSALYPWAQRSDSDQDLFMVYAPTNEWEYYKLLEKRPKNYHFTTEEDIDVHLVNVVSYVKMLQNPSLQTFQVLEGMVQRNEVYTATKLVLDLCNLRSLWFRFQSHIKNTPDNNKGYVQRYIAAETLLVAMGEQVSITPKNLVDYEKEGKELYDLAVHSDKVFERTESTCMNYMDLYNKERLTALVEILKFAQETTKVLIAS